MANIICKMSSTISYSRECSLFHFTRYRICGQSYKHFTIIIYDPRVVIWGIFKSGTTLES